ncbi:putative Holliday junction resolvase [Motilibacter rhizosphaerae]|uniref:Putative pre-16S rRNA nuclease n=1 Tax=Motilibacter rhizosphaerae TaxID=598652 RepID=A0A4Q7NR33_9ACTN|nr:Holliday junction resolvase RuvX [Motilibacter rhizosphaerae]RZS89425.1 putative Holliday junction resolvase [Motilibacter rhizosphaerae]
MTASGVRLGVDVGSVRVGVAVSDPRGTLAVPLETVPRATGRSRTDVDRIAQLVADYAAVEVVVGLPLTLRGEEGAAAEAARLFARRLEGRLGRIPVRFVDERLSTVSATRDLRSAGLGSRESRGRVDASAAAVLLQSALDADRAAQQHDQHAPDTYDDPQVER